MVANELGFLQKLPRKRDSLIDNISPISPQPQTNGLSLVVPEVSASRAPSPLLEPMSARLSDDEAKKTFWSMDDLEDQPSVCMSARVAS